MQDWQITARVKNYWWTSRLDFGEDEAAQTSFTLSEVLAEHRERKQTVVACFIDVRKAYDRVWRDGLWAALWEKGVRGKMWRVLRQYYQNVQSAVKTDGGVTEWFDVDVGVRQGCVISPLLFDVFVDRLAREVKRLGLGVAAGSAARAAFFAAVRR